VRISWCKDIADVVNIARGQGWIFYYNYRGRHYYYVYAGIEAELVCIAVELNEPLKAKYVSIDEDGKLVSSDKPIMPACARVTEILKDRSFEELLEQR
jgi:hypothetical protein